jgi:DNA-binding MarR family transcriptional regulator
MVEVTEQLIAQQILRIMPAIMRVIAAELRTHPQNLVPAQLGVLAYLSLGTRNISELAELQSVSLPTMSGTVSKLVSLGLVQRTRSHEDRRVMLLALTAEGAAVLQELLDHAVARISQNLHLLDRADLEMIGAGLATLGQIFTPFENERIEEQKEQE